jgi:hypothetical protein
MPSSILSLGDLEEYTTNPTEVRAGTAEPTYLQFVFHRDDIGIVEHEGYVEEVSPVDMADFQEVRTLEDEGWRYFATVHVRDSTWNDVRFLFESDEGEIYDAIVETGEGAEMLHPVTVAETGD